MVQQRNWIWRCQSRTLTEHSAQLSVTTLPSKSPSSVGFPANTDMSPWSVPGHLVLISYMYVVSSGNAPVIWNPLPPLPGNSGGKAGVSLGVEWTLAFTSSPNRVGMSGGFTFNLSVVAFSRRWVIWTFDINYLRSSRPRFLRLEMLFKLWRGDRRKALTAASTDTGYPGAGRFHWLSHSHWVNVPAMPGGGGGGFKWLVPPCYFSWDIHRLCNASQNESEVRQNS